MKRAIALFAACDALALPATPGFGFPSSFINQQIKIDSKHTIEINYAYADCVVKRAHDLAAKAILGNVRNGEILHHYSGLIIPDCLVSAANGGVEMSFGGDLYRYALAGALVRKDLVSRSLDDLNQVAPLDHLSVDEAPRQNADPKFSKRKQAKLAKSYRESIATNFLSEYGECVVRADPAGAKAVLLSKPMKPDETTTFKALMPALQNCMPANNTLAFGPLMLRGSLSINYYRLAYAPRTATPTNTVN